MVVADGRLETLSRPGYVVLQPPERTLLEDRLQVHVHVLDSVLIAFPGTAIVLNDAYAPDLMLRNLQAHRVTLLGWEAELGIRHLPDRFQRTLRPFPRWCRSSGTRRV